MILFHPVFSNQCKGRGCHGSQTGPLLLSLPHIFPPSFLILKAPLPLYILTMSAFLSHSIRLLMPVDYSEDCKGLHAVV